MKIKCANVYQAPRQHLAHTYEVFSKWWYFSFQITIKSKFLSSRKFPFVDDLIS